jgi:hypothetical protein
MTIDKSKEIELAPGIFLTKRSTDHAPQAQSLATLDQAEDALLAQGTPADQLEYLLREQSKLIRSNIALLSSNEQLEEFKDDRDLATAIVENVEVMKRQTARIDRLQGKIDVLEKMLGDCTVAAAHASAETDAIAPAEGN